MVPMVKQRADGDCGLAALSMYAALVYEDLYVIAAKLDRKNRGKVGLYNREVIAIAAAAGIGLRPTRRYDLDDEEGILRLRWTCARATLNPEGHMVAVRYGLIFDPADGCAYPWRDYSERYRPRFCTLLRGDA